MSCGNMHTTKRPDGWWIEEIPDAPDAGPYTTRAEAESERRGLERYFQHGHKWSFWTSEPEPRKAKAGK